MKALHLGLAVSALVLNLPLNAGIPFPTATAFLSPTLGSEARELKNFSLELGHFRLIVDRGSATPLLVNGVARGLYIKGEGRFRYISAEASEHAVMRFNLEQNSKLTLAETTEGLTLSDGLKEVILWFGGRELPKPDGPVAPVPAEAYKAAAAFFENRETHFASGFPELTERMPFNQLAAYQARNAPDKTIASAEIIGEHDRFVYTYDDAHSHRESLLIQRPIDPGQIDYVPLVGLSAQPIGWQWKAPHDPDFQLAHIDVDLEADKHGKGKLKLVETIKVIRPGLRALSFHLAELKVGSKSMGRAKTQHVEMKHVTDANGKDLPIQHRSGFLLVDYPRPLANGETVKLTFEMDGEIASDQGGDSFWRLTPGEGWMPEPEMSGNGYTVKARVAVEKPFMPIVSAKTVSRSSNETQNIVEAVLDKPTLWMSIAAGNYKSTEMVRNGRTVRAWCYSGIPKTADKLLKMVHGTLDFYNTVFGNVPFDEINLVQIPSLGMGQAPAGMIWLTSEAFDSISDEDSRMVASRGAVGGWVNRMVSHELGHQYWAHQVKMWGYEDQWITESFAEYTSSLAMRAMKNKGVGTYDVIVKDWEEKAKKATKASSIPTANWLQPNLEGKADRETYAYRQELVYSKGAFLLACIHKEIGEEKFMRFLRTYQKNFAWYPPSITQDVPDLLKAITGKDWQPWFQKYYWGTEMPTLAK